jgi:AMMECR1 domain-containing protein
MSWSLRGCLGRFYPHGQQRAEYLLVHAATIARRTEQFCAPREMRVLI